MLKTLNRLPLQKEYPVLFMSFVFSVR